MSSAPPAPPGALARLQKLEAVLQCPLCHALPTAPVALASCGHHFCSACIRAFLSYEGNSFCPQLLCRAPATTTDFVPMPHLDYRGGAHADFDRRAPRLPHLIGASAASLRKKLQDVGVPATGDLARLEGRHKAFVNAYNVCLDGGCGASKLNGEVLKAVRAWDKTQDELAAAAAAKEKRSRAGVKRGMFRNSKTDALLGKRPLEDGAREMTAVCAAGDALAPEDVVRAGDSTAEMARKIRRAKEARKARDARANVGGGGGGAGPGGGGGCGRGDGGGGRGEAGGNEGGGGGGEAGGNEGDGDEVVLVDSADDPVGLGGSVGGGDVGGGGGRVGGGESGGGGDGVDEDVVVVTLFESDNSVDIPMPPPSPRGLAVCETETADVRRRESVLQTDGLPLSPSTQCRSDVETDTAPASVPAQTQPAVVSRYFAGCARAADGPAHVSTSRSQQDRLMDTSEQSPVDVAHALSAATPAEPSTAERQGSGCNAVDLSPAPRIGASSPRPSGPTASADEIQRKRERAQEKLRLTKCKQDIARKKKEAIAKQIQARQRRLMAEEALRRRRQESPALPGRGR